MSGTHAHTVAYVAPTQFREESPPASEVGFLGWLRENFFSSWWNTLLTILSLAFLAAILPGLVDWAILKSVWNANSLRECRDIIIATHGEGTTGACWAVINERFGQILYGFYPTELRWRPNVAFVLLFVALAPILFRTLKPLAWLMGGILVAKLLWGLYGIVGGSASVSALWSPTAIVAAVVGALALVFSDGAYRKRWLIFSALFPVIAYFLIWGGFVLEPVQSNKIGGFLLTLIIGVTGISASLPLGILLALGRQSNLPVLKTVCVLFIEFIRGVPLITLLFVASTLLNYFLPPGTSFDLILRVLIMVTLFASAYMAEVIRGGLAALPRGQYEAAESIGLTYWQGMRLIILPQALKISIPGIVNTFIGLFKDTTLVAVIGLLDPLGLTNPIRSDSAWNGIVWELYGFIAFIFFIFCWGMSQYSQWLETQLAAGDNR